MEERSFQRVIGLFFSLFIVMLSSNISHAIYPKYTTISLEPIANIQYGIPDQVNENVIFGNLHQLLA